ncbi:hypothetical protein ACPOL_3348 [Acidisarcina polymorpha]|uniref:Uncharacterized protein n=1 Tax=Acidisarcina polymorpha TaxID=2211140 RepID=A0A2Z5G1M1_9BACT|nr:hypothetical protein ACPOL_3348 [Acidisarcina polymorpha]
MDAVSFSAWATTEQNKEKCGGGKKSTEVSSGSYFLFESSSQSRHL